MKTSYALTVFSLGIALLVSACQGGNPLDQPNCKKGTCIKVGLTRTAKMAEASTLTLTVNSQVEDPDLNVYLEFSAPDIMVEGQPNLVAGRPTWKVPIKPNQPVTVTTKVRFPSEGYFLIVATAVTKNYDRAVDDLWVHVTQDGITPNPPPERGPGTPAPAIKVDKTETPRPRTPTPIPPPTRPPYP
jgi:hypothetical protein